MNAVFRQAAWKEGADVDQGPGDKHVYDLFRPLYNDPPTSSLPRLRNCKSSGYLTPVNGQCRSC